MIQAAALSCSLLGIGGYVPDRVLDNETLTRMVDTSDEWITTRTGIRERRILEPGLGGSHMAERASRAALENAGLTAQDVTHILYSTCTPDAMCPPSSCMLSAKLGRSDIFAMDINAACSTFVYGLSLVRGLLAAEPDAVILLVASDVMSSRVNWEDRSTCVLFGDAAGAALFSGVRKGRGKLLDVQVSSKGELGPLLQINGGGSAHPPRLGDTVGPDYFIRMEGREVYKHAVRNMAASCRRLLERNGLTMDDIGLFVPHQANMRIIEGVGSRLEVSGDKIYVNVDVRGNTSSASIPLALAEADQAGRIRPGMKVLLTTFGGGLTWGSALLAF
jgi:3-oxoacyl-[acyl-carrier-protein] synthase-3